MRRGATGWGHGMMGVVIFSGSLPATKLAVADFSALSLTGARAVIAAAIGTALLLIFRQKRPARSDLPKLLIVSGGVVIGFPLLTALALRHVTAAHSLVFAGLLPLSTASFGVLRGGERPGPGFWLFALGGSLLVMGFAAWQGAAGSRGDDLLLVGAILLCGLGYAEGAVLARRLGGWQVICWALLLALPAAVAVVAVAWPARWNGVPTGAWLGLGYVSLFSMLIGFMFWYRGLLLGGIAVVGQLQLLQPLLGLLLAALILHEPVGWTTLAVTALVVLCVAQARRHA
ncbi:DMT family transporter [Rhizosaccharibacter radicis]|uniref:DMT family transporter n=1 Tax=Rhizosaccharibacter radicis TaxID=2782605 RepID=A0ABT1VUW7_9PROT|nr:DMT family transporter [Acetobacteraceae bacterium KSS12]